tara:strand:- start:758 stop:2158 length:1401 start_codon:yes stop_codon:yes gene_type:complete
MNLKTKITLAFILTIFLSCSSETDEDTSPIDSEIVTITPNFGYEGDEITFEMSNPIPSNANVLITYNGQSAIVNEINGTTIKHIVPNNPESSIILTINGQEKNINSATDLRPLKKYIDCENCREKAFVSSNDLPTENILDINKINNNIYLIKTKGSQFSSEASTSLIKTDLDFNIIEENSLFNEHPNSNILFENNNFIIQKDFELLSYDYDGNQLWSYNIINVSSSGGTQNINSIVKHNSHYYLFKNIIFNQGQGSIEILKVNNSGEFVSSVEIPFGNNPNHNSHSTKYLTVLDNKIFGVRSINGTVNNFDSDAYFVIDNNDNILKNSLTNINLPQSNLFVEGNSIYFNDGNPFPNPNSPELKKISLDNTNNLNMDWSRADNGIIAKYNDKYLMFLPENNSGFNAISVFNDNNFNNSDFKDIQGVRYGNSAKVIGNEVYLFGNRTIFFANDYHALVGKYNLNNIVN